MDRQPENVSEYIVIWRDSVCAGDDACAPHELKVKINDSENINSTFRKIYKLKYLPKIFGGKATWIVIGKKPLAVIAQQWRTPYFLVDPTAYIKDFIDFSHDHQLKFEYWCQVDPEEVKVSIKQGNPLPDRYGRGNNE